MANDFQTLGISLIYIVFSSCLKMANKVQTPGVFENAHQSSDAVVSEDRQIWAAEKSSDAELLSADGGILRRTSTPQHTLGTRLGVGSVSEGWGVVGLGRGGGLGRGSWGSRKRIECTWGRLG